NTKVTALKKLSQIASPCLVVVVTTIAGVHRLGTP
ncbi:hypothetical protein A2U01_0081041, partial [Trifolium medium]|nr:hypothetical protein [Trifolium medium]